MRRRSPQTTEISKIVIQGSNGINNIIENAVVSALSQVQNNKSSDEDEIALETIEIGGPKLKRCLRLINKGNIAVILWMFKKRNITQFGN